MKSIKYFFQFLTIVIFFLILKIIGLKNASNFSYKLFYIIGPFFRSKAVVRSNILKALPQLTESQITRISNKMWGNYGRILSEYVFMKNFRNNNIKVIGQEILEQIKISNKPVIFVSGHFNNFELMAMHIEKSGIDLAAIYRPLNNIFLNIIMEKIRKKYICKNQIKKGISGTKELLSFFKKGTSIALMIDQRVTQGISVNFFKNKAFTTTIPAQFAKKFNCKIVPVYIERITDIDFQLTINKPIEYSSVNSIKDITLDLNNSLEKMILNKPDQWIWSHNRWK